MYTLLLAGALKEFDIGDAGLPAAGAQGARRTRDTGQVDPAPRRSRAHRVTGASGFPGAQAGRE